MVASLGSHVDDDDVYNMAEEQHAIASALLDRFIVATDAVKNSPLDAPPPTPASFNTIELEVMLDATERWASWETGWNKQVRSEHAERDAEFCSAMIRQIRAALNEVLDTRTIVITVLPDRGE